MKKGKDYKVEIPKPSVRDLLFKEMGLPGFILLLFHRTFLNLSILSVAIIGMIWQRSIESVWVFFLALVLFGLTSRISQLWNNRSVLSSAKKHVSRYSDCKFEILSNEVFKNKYGFHLIYELVNDPREVANFFIRTSRQNKKNSQVSQVDNKLKSLAQNLVLEAMTYGNQFIICMHPGEKNKIPRELSALRIEIFKDDHESYRSDQALHLSL